MPFFLFIALSSTGGFIHPCCLPTSRPFWSDICFHPGVMVIWVFLQAAIRWFALSLFFLVIYVHTWSSAWEGCATGWPWMVHPQFCRVRFLWAALPPSYRMGSTLQPLSDCTSLPSGEVSWSCPFTTFCLALPVPLISVVTYVAVWVLSLCTTGRIVIVLQRLPLYLVSLFIRCPFVSLQLNSCNLSAMPTIVTRQRAI